MGPFLKESRRVCYIESYPEWFSYSVLRLFYRNKFWLFVPLQDLSQEERLVEYKKAKYFFISGYGHSKQAKEAWEAGCILIGPRTDIPVEIPIVNSKEWEPFGVYAQIKYFRLINIFPWPVNRIASKIIILASKLYWLAYFGLITIYREGIKSAYIKFRKYLSL